MTYDEKLVDRVRVILAKQRGVTEKKLMGTLAFMVNGAMCCSVGRDGLLVRIFAEERTQLLTDTFVTSMTLGSRTMKAFVRVAREALRTRAKLAKWIERGIAAAAATKRKRPQART